MTVLPTVARTALLAGLLVLSPAGWTADRNHSHDDHHAAPLTLDHGKRWPTDAPLRRGMDSMRAAVVGALPAIHAGKYPVASYQGLATRLEGDVGFIVANCRLDERADVQLHGVLARLSAGIEQLKNRDKVGKRQDGVLQVVAALNAYGEHFDHPGWQALAH